MPRRKPDLTAYVEPSARLGVADWTPARIRQAELLADAGNLMIAADLADSLQGDDEVQGALSTLVGALTALPLTFEASGDRRRSRRAVRALEADEDFWCAFSEPELVTLITWAVLVGVGVAEIDWTEDPETGRLPGRIKVWSPRLLRWDVFAREWRLRTGDAGEEIVIAPGDGRWILFTPRGPRRPWKAGAYRALARWYLLKTYAVNDWGAYSERHGTGVLVAEADAAQGIGGTLEKRKQLAKDLQSLGRNSAIALPAGFKLRLVEATANTAQTFEKQIAFANDAIRMALHGTGVTNEQGGSYAKAQVLNGVRLQVVASLAEALATTLHDQHLVYWAEFNFGDRRLAPWPKWDATPPADLKAEGEALGAVAAACAALKAVSDRVDVDRILEDNGVPLREAAPTPVPPKEAEVSATLVAQALAARKRRPSALVRGQVYADAIGDATLALNAMAPTLRRVLDVVESATDYASLRSALLETFRNLEPVQLAEVVERAVMLAELGGRLAVRCDLSTR